MVKKGQSLLWGTIILLISNIFVKGLGFFYRIVLVRLLGAEGMGLIEMANPVYTFLLVLAGWGISLAISQKTAEASAKGQLHTVFTIFRSGRVILAVSGICLTALSFIAVPLLIKYIVPDDRIYHCLKALLPSIAIITAASAYRGHFQGIRQVSTLGVSQSIEQAVRVATGLLLVNHLLDFGIERAVTAVSYATVFGETAGFAYLLWRYNRNKRDYLNFGIVSGKQVLSLFKFGTPVTMNRLAATGIMMLEALLIPLCLQHAGWDMRGATEMYGRFSGVAMALMNLPGVFTAALSVSVLPAVAESGFRNKALLRNNVSHALQATNVFTLPAMVILCLFATELCKWIFNSPLAGEPLRILALGGVFLYMQVTLNSVLQGLGEVKALLINSILSGMCLLAGVVLLTSMPALGISGAAIATDTYYIVGFSLNLLVFKRVTKIKLPWRNIIVKPVIGISLGILAIKIASFIHPAIWPQDEKLAFLCMSALMCLVYFIFLLLSKGLSIGIWRRLINRNP